MIPPQEKTIPLPIQARVNLKVNFSLMVMATIRIRLD
jgi:hypothetical protein